MNCPLATYNRHRHTRFRTIKPGLTKARRQNGCDTMNFESFSSFEIVVRCDENGALASQQLLNIPGQFVEALKQSPPHLTSTPAMYEPTTAGSVNTRLIWLANTHWQASGNQCTHSPPPFPQFPSRPINNRLHQAVSVSNRHFKVQNGRQGNWKSPSRVRSDNISLSANRDTALHLNPTGCLATAKNGPTAQYAKHQSFRYPGWSPHTYQPALHGQYRFGCLSNYI